MKVPFWNSLSPRKRKLALWIFGLLLFYTVTGFLILPPIVRSVAVKQISKQLDREVSIETVKINPFALSTTVRGLLIKDKDGEPFVSWDEVYVNFQLSSFFGKAWVFKEISTTKPFVRAQMNKDGTFNFSDLIAKFSTNAPRRAQTATPAKPLVLHVGPAAHRRRDGGAGGFHAARAVQAHVGPLDITLDNFRTDPDNKNPYAFTGTTDAGEQISWSGFFYLDPLRSQGELKLFNFTLNKYAPLYQDFVRFEIRDGSIALDAKYRFELERDQPRRRRERHGVRAARFQARRARRQQQHRRPAAVRPSPARAWICKAARPRWIPCLRGRRETFSEPRQERCHQRRRTVQAGGHRRPTRRAAFCFCSAPSPTPSRCCSTARTNGAARSAAWTSPIARCIWKTT